MHAETHTVSHMDGFEEYEREAQKFLDSFAAFVTEHFGERCNPTDVECPCCMMWALYDQAKKVVD